MWHTTHFVLVDSVFCTVQVNLAVKNIAYCSFRSGVDILVSDHSTTSGVKWSPCLDRSELFSQQNEIFVMPDQCMSVKLQVSATFNF